MLDRGLVHGTEGGKVCGAVRRSFLLVDCLPEHAGRRVAKGMADHRELPFQHEREGSNAVSNYRREVSR